jgi:SAM-dependent methyltransferase
VYGESVSRFGKIYAKTYDFLCGKHPDVYFWHFQWHFLKDTLVWQKRVMKELYGDILDVGCGDKPYKSYVSTDKIKTYIGLDIQNGDNVDYVVEPGSQWPFDDSSFDCVILTQTLEHFSEVQEILNEVSRILKKDGLLMVTVPFMCPQHGAPYDFRRYTIYGLKKLFSKDYKDHEVVALGNIGSVFAYSLLTNIENNLNQSLTSRILKGIFLPFYIVLSFLINLFGLLLNLVDKSKTHYCNSCALFVKK